MKRRVLVSVVLLVGLTFIISACGSAIDPESVEPGSPASYWLVIDQLFGREDVAGDIIDPMMDTAVDYLIINWGDIFDALEFPIKVVLNALDAFLVEMVPWPVVLIAVFLLGYFIRGWKLGLLGFAGLLLQGLLGYWALAMSTVAMILTAVVLSVIIGTPLGILAARNDRVADILRPVLDAMQTVHPFVYLVPVVMFFGIGKVPGTLATLAFALPPIVRLTNLGIRQVPSEVVEASVAFGATENQTLFEVQLPLAMPTIMAGLNQTLMLALSMVVIVAMIAGGGLGSEIIRGVNRLEVGRAVRSGLAVLLLAVVLDRISQARAEGQSGSAE